MNESRSSSGDDYLTVTVTAAVLVSRRGRLSGRAADFNS